MDDRDPTRHELDWLERDFIRQDNRSFLLKTDMTNKAEFFVILKIVGQLWGATLNLYGAIFYAEETTPGDAMWSLSKKVEEYLHTAMENRQ